MTPFDIFLLVCAVLGLGASALYWKFGKALRKRCPGCLGNGDLVPFWSGKVTGCRICNGRGWIPAESDGKA